VRQDLDNLIRDARPATSDLARQRVIEQVAPAFVPVRPMPWLRVAAVLALAAASGFAAVAWQGRAADPAPDGLEALQADLVQLRQRSDALDARAAGLASRGGETATGQPLDRALAAEVSRVLDERERQRREQYRERHLAYARRQYQQEVENAVVELRARYRLGDDQEAQVRKVFAEHGAQVETLIGKHYRGGFHGKGRGRGMDHEFDRIREATESRLALLLAEVPRSLPGADLADWGPNPVFATATDYETWLNWSEETRQSG
jgi:hypothetical protein